MTTSPAKNPASHGVHLDKTPQVVNFFHYFHLPLSYRVDSKVLDKAYEAQCLATHPDFLPLTSEEEKAKALENSAAINRAYQVLAAENSRSVHLLELLSQGQKLNHSALPQGFLEKMLLLQEEVEKAQTNPKTKLALKQQVQQSCQQCVAERGMLFSSISPLQPNVPMLGGVLQKICETLNVERYLRRILAMLVDP